MRITNHAKPTDMLKIKLEYYCFDIFQKLWLLRLKILFKDNK